VQAFGVDDGVCHADRLSWARDFVSSVSLPTNHDTLCRDFSSA